ncbi:PspC domain-containing protein [Agromyces seonyuensis]|uniref:PspC domain-containing protein n=1 Tax=Agromyces seonyuensis TaxID=2662446 RepID=A0A6I4P379_9MICO|nr:PspC domain-containing protein [Agromyces seonyuensis]MWC00133.1 PspC domain-containing protein [Agromyces seonyuensis]
MTNDADRTAGRGAAEPRIETDATRPDHTAARHPGPTGAEPPLPPEPPRVPPGDGTAGAPGTPRRGDGGARFFDWMRANTFPRRNGWLGGVCAGLAWRLGIDPIIVRGVAVVLALFGLPMIFLYAAAWALLPDETGRIHVEDVFRGKFEPASVGIVILLVAAMLPIGNWFGSIVSRVWAPWTWNEGWWGWGYGFDGGAFVFFLLVLAGIGALVFWAVRRNRAGGAAGTTPATGPGEPNGPAAGPAASGANAADASTRPFFAAAPVSPQYGPPVATEQAAPEASSAVPEAPVAPAAPAGTSDEELAAWRAQQEAWKRDRDEYQRAQADADKAAKAKWAAENKARAASFQAMSEAERAKRRAERPRTSFAFVVAAIGVAIIAGGVTAALLVGDGVGFARLAGVALLAAGGALGLAMVVAGFARRRSGWLALLAVLALLAGFPLAAAPRGDVYLQSYVSIGAGGANASYVQPAGDMDVQFDATPSDPEGTRTEIAKVVGDVRVDVDDDAYVRITTALGDGELYVIDSDGAFRTIRGDGERTVVIGEGPGEPDELVIATAVGNVTVERD